MLQCDIPLKASAPEKNFMESTQWRTVHGLKSVALHWTELSVSTYLCEEVLSQKMILKPSDRQTFQILPSLVPK
jgi:hypothetical protein